MRVYVHVEPNVDIVNVLPAENSWFSSSIDKDKSDPGLLPGISDRLVIFPQGGATSSICEGVYVYYERDPDHAKLILGRVTMPPDSIGIVDFDSIKVYDKSMKLVAEKHMALRIQRFRMIAVTDAIRAHMVSRRVDVQNIQQALLKLQLTPEQYVEKNDLFIHEEVQRRAVLVYVPFGEAN